MRSYAGIMRSYLPLLEVFLVILQQTAHCSEQSACFVGGKVTRWWIGGKSYSQVCALVDKHKISRWRSQRHELLCKISDEDRRKLEDSFRAGWKEDSAKFKGVANEFEVQEKETSIVQVFDEIRNVPILTENRQSSVDRKARKATVMFPGMKQILLIEQPNECHMMETLLALPPPHLFGFLPQASSSLAEEETSFGNLMEVVRSRQLEDGSLLLLVVTIGRIEALRTRSAIPYTRKDCRVMVDEEEVEAKMQAGRSEIMAKVRKLEPLGQDVIATVHDGYFENAARLFATAMASRESLMWRKFEMNASASMGKASQSFVLLNRNISPLVVANEIALDSNNVSSSIVSEALHRSGYRPMMREGQLPGLQEEETMPPSWLEVLDHFEERLEEEDPSRRRMNSGEYGETKRELERILSSREEGRSMEAGAREDETRRRSEVKEWRRRRRRINMSPANKEKLLLRLEALTWRRLDTFLQLKQVFEGGDTANVSQDFFTSSTFRSLPQELQELHPRSANSDWPISRRAQRLSWVVASILRKFNSIEVYSSQLTILDLRPHRIDFSF
ncbi:hypothetical protein GUITHDRAFT_132094 [Guillardia theta CCMP2712]|uniref:Lon N-terminal domain-containing protein n=1 Tax=Guillardia theta (strain CCMP2712) TaxID=905079 RepID=L1K0J2_GUITC|nr:hypothetical protein GUITHDRAFT_132094 [Guillardia theta CCMP2712]EKX54346.1 hypothetical protein GUITHDRAFT_132094 [Guillardia theta CCMP2712]|eukprot:XP_005841326.1 hypothetical protein GUITHDRAFT_132094 [Guillardia theta CCMP2712]